MYRKLTYNNDDYTPSRGLYTDESYIIEIWDFNFDFEPAERGSRDSMGVPLEPDYPACVDFTYADSVTLERYVNDDGDSIPVDPDTLEFHKVAKQFENDYNSEITDYLNEHIDELI